MLFWIFLFSIFRTNENFPISISDTNCIFRYMKYQKTAKKGIHKLEIEKIYLEKSFCFM